MINEINVLSLLIQFTFSPNVKITKLYMAMSINLYTNQQKISKYIEIVLILIISMQDYCLNIVISNK